MKRILTAALLIFPLAALANDQYSQRRCDSLNAERETIRKRFNSGYGVSERNYLNKRDRELFMLISTHCKKPVQERRLSTIQTPVRSEQTTSSSATTSSVTRSPRANFSARNHVFSPEKSAAWDAFYKIPARCRSRDTAPEDFVFYAEDKADQRREFERQWSKQNP